MQSSKKGRKGRDFTEKVKRQLRERVAYMCSNPMCRRLTVRPIVGGKTTGVVRQGKAAHIFPASPGGPRGQVRVSDAHCKSFHNGIWLCDVCARMVDDDRDAYPENLLRRWKTDAETYVSELVTQDTRLRQLRSMVAHTLSSLRILTALPGPGPTFDQTTRDSGGIPLTRSLIETEQTLFENDFLDEANKIRRIIDHLEQCVYPAIRRNPATDFLDISRWKNCLVRIVMVDIMHFSEESYERYSRIETRMVEEGRGKLLATGHQIHDFALPNQIQMV